EVSLQYDDQILTAMANATQIHQVVVNLTTNAVHAIGSRHGHVRLRVHAATIEDEQATPLLAAGRYVCLSVEDDGQGMDRETMGKI
ncbi:ATP-binding protein, partial [Staphylococcus aureus]